MMLLVEQAEAENDPEQQSALEEEIRIVLSQLDFMERDLEVLETFLVDEAVNEDE